MLRDLTSTNTIDPFSANDPLPVLRLPLLGNIQQTDVGRHAILTDDLTHAIELLNGAPHRSDPPAVGQATYEKRFLLCANGIPGVFPFRWYLDFQTLDG